MPDNAFRIDQGLPAIAALTARGLGREEFIARSLAVLTESIGFERARFYEATTDIARRLRIVVLTAQEPRQQDFKAGVAYSFSDSTIARQESGIAPVVGEAGQGNDEPPWVDDLDLGRRRWVEIPITAAGETIGVIAADWSDVDQELTASELAELQVVGNLVGSHLALKPIALLTRYRSIADAIETAPTESPPPPQKLVINAAERLGQLLDVASTAVFAFSWPHQRLDKIRTFVAPRFEDTFLELGDFDETYAVGEHLTGLAWHDKRVRHLVSFESLDEVTTFDGVPKYGRDLIARDSELWHRALLDEDVRSVMYTVVGALDRRYLIRFINRASRPELPFLGEAEYLEAMASELRSDLDALVANQRTQSLEELAMLASEVTEPDALIAQVASGLAREGVNEFIVLCHQREAAQFGFAALSGARLKDVNFSASAEWASDALYKALTERHAHRVSRLSDYSESSQIAAILRKQEFSSILSVRIRSAGTEGLLIVPMDARISGRRQTGSLPDGCEFGTLSLLMAYASLIGNAVERRHSAAKSDGALRALGFLGHELRAPLAELNSAAELSINTARRTVRDLKLDFPTENRVLTRLREREQVLHDRQHDVSFALSLSGLVARQNEGTLQLHFESTPLREVIDRAILDVRSELRLDRDPRRIDIDIAASVDRVPSINADPDHLRHAFKNIIRNAVNYSIPRTPGAPMRVELFGERQQSIVAIKVRNWGLGVPPGRRDLIFEPWVRGGVEDRFKAIRGMGLGLYLTRRIVSGHDGTVLFNSKFTLNDQKRRELLEGFETEVEVRLPRNLKAGTYTHEWTTEGESRTHPPREESKHGE